MRPPLSRAISFAILLAAPPATALAMLVPINHAQRIDVRGVAASVVVGNPTIADVSVIDSHTVYISGRNFGQTDVVVLDPNGRAVYASDVVVASQEGGLITVFRGADRMDFACAATCAPAARNGAGGATATTSSSVPSNTGGKTLSIDTVSHMLLK